MDRITSLSELGEFGLLDHLARKFATNPPDVVGIGDDAAVIPVDDNTAQVITTDMFVEGIHYDFAYFPLHLLGWKVVSATLSDVAAMRARPSFFLHSMALGSRFTLEGVEAIYDGIQAAAKYYKISIIGGDTTTILRGSVLHGVAVGYAHPSQLAFRKGAQPGDLICVSGNLGAAYLGLQILEREKKVLRETQGVAPQLEKYRYLLERFFRPVARFDIVDQLNEKDIKVHAMIDLSDGLSSDLLHILHQSNVGADLHEELLPIDPVAFQTALELNLLPATCALHGGEDYELLFTVPPTEEKKVRTLPDVTIIGTIHKDSTHRIFHTTGGDTASLTAQGWDSFLKKQQSLST